MKAQKQLNYLALYQNILNKPIILGQGPKEGSSETPKTTFHGLEVYLNGIHKMPIYDKQDKGFIIGSMTHPYAMIGMPSTSGVLSYEFWTTDKEYIILVSLELEESEEEESDPATDVLAIVKKDQIPKNIIQNEESFPLICQDMMLCHFESLFEFYENLEDLEKWSFEEDTLYSYVKYHFELKNNEKAIDNALKQ